MIITVSTKANIIRKDVHNDGVHASPASAVAVLPKFASLLWLETESNLYELLLRYHLQYGEVFKMLLEKYEYPVHIHAVTLECSYYIYFWPRLENNIQTGPVQ